MQTLTITAPDSGYNDLKPTSNDKWQLMIDAVADVVTDRNDNSPIYKIVIAGEGNVGKTSTIRQFCEGKFNQSRIATMGVDFQVKRVTLSGKAVRLSIWDIAGQEQFLIFRDMFYGGAHAVALVYDVTAPATFFALSRWRDEIQAVMPGVPIAIVGNKLDLYQAVPADDVRAWAKEQSMPFLQTSAATGDHIKDFFIGLGYMALFEQRRRNLAMAR